MDVWAVVRAVILVLAAAPGTDGEDAARLTREKQVRARFAEKIKPLDEQKKAEVADINSTTKAVLSQLAEELKSIRQERHKLYYASSDYKVTPVDKNRRKHELASRSVVIKKQAVYVRSHGGRKAAGIARRYSVLRSRLVYKAEELCKRIRAGEQVTDAEVDAAIQACLATKPCPKCKGQGHIECPNCKGKGTTSRNGKCPDCMGKGEIWAHPSPRDPGKADTEFTKGTTPAKAIACPRCKGRGTTKLDMTCLKCFGEGSLECDRCWGKGTLVEASP